MLVLRSRPHGPVLPAHLRLPKQPHGQRGGAAHEGARALGGRAAVRQPPARRQQQPHSSCQSRPRGQPGQAALSSQGAHGRGEERMRPEQSRDPGTAVRPSRGCQGPGTASLAAFHAPLLFLCRCRFISLIYQHYLCLETFVKLFLFPALPQTSQAH